MFDKIVFIIRKDIEQDFREIIGNRIEKLCSEKNVEVAYTFQALDDLPANVVLPEGRKKPWGTGHAIYAARDLVDAPFCAINADDFYGYNAFKLCYDHLCSLSGDGDVTMVGYLLKNTLSETGSLHQNCLICGEVAKTEEIPCLGGNVESWNLTLSDDLAVNFMIRVPESFVAAAKIVVTVAGETSEYSVLKNAVIYAFNKVDLTTRG